MACAERDRLDTCYPGETPGQITKLAKRRFPTAVWGSSTNCLWVGSVVAIRREHRYACCFHTHLELDAKHRNLDGVNANLHGAEAIRSLLTSNIEIGLARCYLMISKARTTNELTWNEAEGPLLFNSLSILRGIHVRVLTGLCGVDRMVLLNDVEEDVTMAVTDYVTSSSTRDRATVRSVHSLFDNIMTILKLDANILRKTAAFNWSVEHAIVGVDCGK